MLLCHSRCHANRMKNLNPNRVFQHPCLLATIGPAIPFGPVDLGRNFGTCFYHSECSSLKAQKGLSHPLQSFGSLLALMGEGNYAYEIRVGASSHLPNGLQCSRPRIRSDMHHEEPLYCEMFSRYCV